MTIRLYSCGFDGSLCIWKRKQDDEWTCSKKILISDEGTCWAFDYDPSNPQKIITVTSKSEVKLFNIVNGDSIFLPTKHFLSINTISWSSNDEIVTGGTDNCLGIYNKLRNYLYISQAHEDDINSVDWNPNDKSLFATASDDCLIKLWKVRKINTLSVKK